MKPAHIFQKQKFIFVKELCGINTISFHNLKIQVAITKTSSGRDFYRTCNQISQYMHRQIKFLDSEQNIKSGLNFSAASIRSALFEHILVLTLLIFKKKRFF